MTDLQAAIGVAQMKKLPGFINKRKETWNKLDDFFRNNVNLFQLVDIDEKAEPSPFCYSATICVGAPFTRADIVKYLEERGIQTRMLFAGNITKHPCMDNVKYRVSGELKNTDRVMMDTFLLGVYPGLTDEMVEYMIKTIEEFIAK